jgi:uroporphyrinogen decarboxylase
MRTLFTDALKRKNFAARPPVWLMRQAGRYMPSYRLLRSQYPFLTLCHEPDLIAKITLLPIQEFDFDAAIVFSDILLVLEAMGFHLVFEENSGPKIVNHLKSPPDVAKLSCEPIHLTYLVTAIQNLKRELSVPLIGFAGAPFTLASYLIEGKTSPSLHNTKVWAYQHLQEFQRLIDRLTDQVIASLKQQAEAGCDALQLFDSWAHVLTENHFQKWCIKPLQKIVQALKPFKTPVIYFCKGSAYLSPQIAETGVDAVSVDWIRPLSDVRKKLPSLPLQGNLDPEALFLPPHLLRQEIRSLLKTMEHDPAFIFNLGHGILPNTPYEHVRCLVDTVNSSAL